MLYLVWVHFEDRNYYLIQRLNTICPFHCILNFDYQTQNYIIFVFKVSWSSWGDYEGCSVTCGEGVKIRRRTCQDPDMTGDVCPGEDSEEAVCTGPTCGTLILTISLVQNYTSLPQHMHPHGQMT